MTTTRLWCVQDPTELKPIIDTFGLIHDRVLSSGAELLTFPKSIANFSDLVLKFPADATQIPTTLEWVSQNLFPKELWIIGFREYIGLGELAHPWHIPTLCARQAGRLDIGAAPILYEQLHFQSELRERCVQQLRTENCYAQGIFSGVRSLKAKEKNWVFSHLRCVSYDDWSGAVALFAIKTLQLPTAAVFCLYPTRSDSASPTNPFTDLPQAQYIEMWNQVLSRSSC